MQAPDAHVVEQTSLRVHVRAVAPFVALFVAFCALALTSIGAANNALVASDWLGAAIIIVGIRRYRPTSAPAWWFFASSLAVGGVARLVDTAIHGSLSHTNNLDVLPTSLYLFGYALLLAGIITWSRHVIGYNDKWGDSVDACILLSAVGFVAWKFIVQPLLSSSASADTNRTLTALSPAIAVLLVVMLLRIALSRDARSWTALGLLTSAVFGLSAQLIPALAARGGTDGSVSLTDVLAVASAAILGMTALHRGMADVGASPTPIRHEFALTRFIVLGGAMLACPVSLAIASVGLHQSFHAAELVVPSILVTALVVVRLCMLFRTRCAAEAELAGREYRFRSLIENLNDLVLLVRADGKVLYQSPSVQRLLGFKPDTLLGESLMNLIVEGERPALAALGAECLSQPGATVRGSLSATDLMRDVHMYEISLTNLIADPHIGGIIAVLRDVTERGQLETALRDQALHDSLTGLPNRALFSNRAERLLEIASLDHVPVSVLFVDLDNFKTVNDGLGHGAGDGLLIAVANRMASAMRSADTVCRFGGDEFVVLIDPHATDATAELMAERLRDVLRVPFEIGGQLISMTASIGITKSCDLDIDTLVRNADIAMYQAKSGGKNATVTFMPQMQAMAQERLQLEIDLRSAIKNHEFAVVYQPTIDLRDYSVSGVEALVRWDHPTRGRLTPDDFIPLAEENGMIVEIGQFVLREACAKAASWQNGEERLSLSVNLSPRQLELASLIDDVKAVLDETGLDPLLLVLEITETAIMKDADVVVERLDALKALGVRLAIDDFGTGYSSLSYLRRFPFDILKIDRSFVSCLQESSDAVAIVHSLMELGLALKLEIIAEGVELESQLRLLEADNCDTAQGYLFARPLPPKQLEAFLEDWVLGHAGVLTAGV
jgi:diguanylate cyclase (GGDEF)-like protein/PAS domain S-box-containing protein